MYGYLHRQCVSRGNRHLYGFIDPQDILTSYSSTENVISTIQNRLHKGRKVCYLAPYLDSQHFQLLIICPRTNDVVFLCSLQRKPNTSIKNIVNVAVSGFQILKGSRKKPTWHFPDSPTQDGATECGFYVMRHMLNIVTVSITGSWMERFCTTKPFPREDLYDIQKRWTRLFLDLYPTRVVE